MRRLRWPARMGVSGSRLRSGIRLARSAGSVGSYGTFDHVCDVRCIRVFPEPKYRPPGRGQRHVGVEVAGAVDPHLSRPVLGVRLRGNVVSRATVPEAPVNEDCQPGPSEHQVCASSHSVYGSMIDPVSKAPGVDDTPDGDLGAGVAATVRPHRLPDARAGGPRFAHIKKIARRAPDV